MYWSRCIVAVALFIGGICADCIAHQSGGDRKRPVPEADTSWFPDGWLHDQQVVEQWSRKCDAAERVCKKRLGIWNDEVELNGGVVDDKLASRLVDELWYDTGVPNVNGIHQIMVLSYILTYSKSQSTTPEAREILRSGLIDYYENGGAELDDSIARRLYKALGMVSHEDDAEVAAIRQALANTWGFGAPAGDGRRPGAGKARSSAEGARELLRKLRAFERAGGQDAGELEAIIKRAAQGFGDERVDGIVCNALLRTYGQLLGRQKNGPPVAVVKLIDKDLVRIGKLTLKQRTTRLLWARVVGLMGDRASQRLRSVVAQWRATERDRAVRSALERSAKLLGQ